MKSFKHPIQSVYVSLGDDDDDDDDDNWCLTATFVHMLG